MCDMVRVIAVVAEYAVTDRDVGNRNTGDDGVPRARVLYRDVLDPDSAATVEANLHSSMRVNFGFVLHWVRRDIGVNRETLDGAIVTMGSQNYGEPNEGQI